MYWPAEAALIGPGQDVVEHQGGDRQLGQEAAHRLLDHPIDAAADEQRTALDIDRADGVAEEHHGQDEPRGGRADGVLDDAADVVGRAGQVAEHHGRRPPVGDEGEHHAADDDHLDRPPQTVAKPRSGIGGAGRISHAIFPRRGGRNA